MSSKRLAALFDADYRDHGDVPPVDTDTYRALRERDRARREVSLRLLRSIESPTADDYYYVAWIWNHGEKVADATTAHEHAKRAMEMGHRRAAWLVAATLDRSLMYAGLPQKFGTQIVPDGTRHRVWDLDGSMNDADRAAHDVPSLAAQHARARALTETAPQPPMHSAPEWLKQAIIRWTSESEADSSLDMPR
jgi:hypothetical protein